MTAFSADTLQSILDAALVAANERQQTFRYRVSSAGDPCERALAYDARAGKGRPTADVRYVLAQACGTAVGEVLEAGCSKLGMKVQEKVVLGGPEDVFVSGTLDVRAEGYVLDWKVVGKKSWRRIAKEPDPKHVLQVNAYCAATKEPAWALAYLNGASIFDELEWRIFRGKADPLAGQRVLSTWRLVDWHHKNGTLPARPDNFSMSSFPCGWNGGGCTYRDTCWSEP